MFSKHPSYLVKNNYKNFCHFSREGISAENVNPFSAFSTSGCFRRDQHERDMTPGGADDNVDNDGIPRSLMEASDEDVMANSAYEIPQTPSKVG